MGCGVLANYYGAFDFRELNPHTHTLERITDIGKLIQIGHDISPLYHIDAKAPPTLILHGDADHLVPIQQSQLVMEKLNELRHSSTNCSSKKGPLMVGQISGRTWSGSPTGSINTWRNPKD